MKRVVLSFVVMALLAGTASAGILRKAGHVGKVAGSRSGHVAKKVAKAAGRAAY